MSDHELRAVDRPDDYRYELLLDDRGQMLVVSFATYRISDGVMTIPHVETGQEHRGNGFADVLMSEIVDDARSRGLMIRPVCPFAAAHMNDRPSTHDLIAG
jgi:predicted GNAT family acetyltransferase